MKFIDPKFIKKGFAYFDETSQRWILKDNAPKWAIKEFNLYVDPETGQLLKIPEDDLSMLGKIRTYYIDENGNVVDKERVF